MSKGGQIAIGALLIAGLIGWYGYTNVGEASFQYYETLDEFRNHAASSVGRSLRVHGYVVNDSIERDLEGRQVRFAVQNDPPHAGGPVGQTLPVVFMSLETPDLFKDGAEVVIEGEVRPLVGAGGADGTLVFQAANVMAKCPSKFQAEAALEAPAQKTL